MLTTDESDRVSDWSFQAPVTTTADGAAGDDGIVTDGPVTVSPHAANNNMAAIAEIPDVIRTYCFEIPDIIPLSLCEFDCRTFGRLRRWRANPSSTEQAVCREAAGRATDTRSEDCSSLAGHAGTEPESCSRCNRR